MNKQPLIAIIGGSGLYEMPGLEEVQERAISTPFGAPSAPVLMGMLNGTRVAFLARHGRGHILTPTEVPYRANIWALKSLGVRFVLAVSACGSLREDYAPGHIVVPDQIYDNTHLRACSFFEGGFVVHVGVADPFCNAFGDQVVAACEKAGATVHQGGGYITIEGPRFSTRAESNTYRSWGLSIIGMTTSPEAFLAREAELHYAVMAHVTDYDVWHEEPVSADMVIRTIQQNTQTAQDAIHYLVADLQPDQECACEHALANAFITDISKAPKAALKKVDLLVHKYLKK